MSKEKVPMKIVVPLIVVTWVLSLVSSLAIVNVVPGLLGIKTEIGTGSITSSKLADGAILTVKLANNNVTSAKILDGTITAVDLADGSIITVKVADGAITTSKIANGSVTSAKIADGNVTASKISDGAIVTVKLADGSVTSAKILDGTVIAQDLANSSIITAKIADGAVTTSKIADYAVTNIKLASGAIPFNATNGVSGLSTTSTSFVNMTGMSVKITLPRNSTVVIMFSAEAWAGSGGAFNLMYVRAMVNSTQANPVSDNIQFAASGPDYAVSYAFNFYGDFTAGTYTVNIQWRSLSSTTSVIVYMRSLIVFALPK